MDPTLEMAMPAPQWLFGYEISEEQRLLFARLYLQYAWSCGPVQELPREALSDFLDQCTQRGLQLAVPRELAIDILRRPDVFGWAHPLAQQSAATRSVFDRGRELLLRTNRRSLKRS